MRAIVTLALGGCALLVLALSAIAQTGTREFDPLGEFDNLPKMVQVQVEFIDVSHVVFTKLMSGEALGSGRALRKAAAELIAAGEAGIIDTQMVIARPGQRATSESVEEFIYPTEYEPASVPEKVHTNEDGEEVSTEAPELATGPTPTAFETRNLGSTLEVEPNIGVNDKIIDLRFAPEIVYHVGNEVWAEWTDSRGEAPIRMPTFYSLRLNTSVTLVDGEPFLVAALSPKGEDGMPDFKRKVMVFVRADIVSPGR